MMRDSAEDRLALILRIAAKHIEPEWPDDGPWAEVSHIARGDNVWIKRAWATHKGER